MIERILTRHISEEGRMVLEVLNSITCKTSIPKAEALHDMYTGMLESGTWADKVVLKIAHRRAMRRIDIAERKQAVLNKRKHAAELAAKILMGDTFEDKESASMARQAPLQQQHSQQQQQQAQHYYNPQLMMAQQRGGSGGGYYAINNAGGLQGSSGAQGPSCHLFPGNLL